MDVLDPLEAFLEVLLHSLRVLGLPQNLQQIIVGHEVEAREHHPLADKTSHAVEMIGVWLGIELGIG